MAVRACDSGYWAYGKGRDREDFPGEPVAEFELREPEEAEGEYIYQYSDGSVLHTTGGYKDGYRNFKEFCEAVRDASGDEKATELRGSLIEAGFA